jgi:UDP-glucose 4-epimerase
MKVMVTGGAGFIGSHIVDALYTAGHEVIVIDNFSTGLRENLDFDKVVVYDVNIDTHGRETIDIIKQEKPEVIFHLAAHPGVPHSMQNPIGTHDVNVSGTLHILEGARQAETKRVVFSSSSSVYGGALVQPTPEKNELNPRSPYAMQKMMGEQYCKLYSEIYGLDTVCLRYFNVFGPRQRSDSPYAAVVAAFVDCAKTGKQPIIYGDGMQCRDFCHVENVVQANMIVGFKEDPFCGGAFNVGCGKRITINEVHKLSGAPPARNLPDRPGDVRRSQAAIHKLKRFGYKPEVSFEEGIRRLLEENN